MQKENNKLTRAEKIVSLRRYFFITFQVTRRRFGFKVSSFFNMPCYTKDGKYFNLQSIQYSVLKILNIKKAVISILSITELNKEDYDAFVLKTGPNGEPVKKGV